MGRAFVVVLCLVSSLLALGAPSSSPAQTLNLYYQEASKDGRVYVFNTAARYKTWQEGGEMGTALILVGRGANGETVVAENETAADLYFFKHDLPGYERPAPKPEKPFDERVFYKDGKTNFVMKAGTVQLSTHMQARYTYLDRLQNDRGSFRIRRMKSVVEGNTYGGTWRFKLQANWVGANVVNSATVSASNDTTKPLSERVTLSTTATRGTILEDAELWFAKFPLATVWIGQGKAYFGRQELISDGKLHFVDRWVGNARFAPSRDQGIGLIGANGTKKYEYNLGLYNGNLINQTLNDNVEYMYVGRLVWTPFGEYKLEESAHDYPETPKLLLGAAGLNNTLTRGQTDTDIWRVGGELAFKWHGFNSSGEYYYEDAEISPRTTVARGYYVQAGWLFPNRKFELAGRYAHVDDELLMLTISDLNRNPLAELREYGACASWYFDKHTHKIQANWLRFEDTLADQHIDEYAMQLQLVF
jgi:hypothetical protein